MSLKEKLGFGHERKIRYGIVALGSIAQEALMPGVEHTGNSEITALVTSDPLKASQLGDKYKVERSYSYDQFPDLLKSGVVDALYIATPNWRHAEFAVPALEAGIHVLLEKPMEVSSEGCLKIITASERSGAKLMIAYRLHFEPATIAAIEKVRSRKLGHVHLFSSNFSQMVDTSNHRVLNGLLAGPIFDMGAYPINAVRHIFGVEPLEAFATASRHPDSGFKDLDDTFCVILRFPEGRLAHFSVSYYANALNTYTISGTEGILEVNPGYTYGKPLAHWETIGQDKSSESFKNTDHFGGELKYFSDCILNDTRPEPDGYEGLADVRVIEAIVRSISSGQFERVEPTDSPNPIRMGQEEKLRAVDTPNMVHASSPARGVEKNPKN